MLRRALPLALVGAVCLSATAPAAMAGQTSFTDTSVTGTWTVPVGVEVVQVDLQGAKGGDGLSSGTSLAGSGNWGARIKSSISVTPGEVLEIGLGTPGESATGSAGGNDGGVTGLGLGNGGAGGANGFYRYDGGGGGGASAIRIGSSVVLVSGGGGGGGSANDGGLTTGASGGSGGAGSSGYVVLNGSTSVDGSQGSAGSNPSGAQGGGGGTGSAGGSAGDGGSLGSSPGSLNNGGNGGSNLCAGGGGGSGYYGGGGGGGAASFADSGCGGGGAGSSFMDGTRTSGNFIVSDSPVSVAGSAQINYIDFTTTTFTTATVGESYIQSIATTFDGVSSPDTWSVSPALPSGLSLNTRTGVITGTPTATSSATYTVTAEVTSIGTVARSSRDFTLTVAAATPGAPIAVTATAGDASATVSFSAPASDGGSAITGYTVIANPGGASGTGASSPITVSGLTNGVAYTFTVAATNNVGTGVASSSSSAVTPSASGSGGGGGGGGGSAPATSSPAATPVTAAALTVPTTPDPMEEQRAAEPSAPTIPRISLPRRIKPKGRTVLIPHRLYTDQGAPVQARAKVLPLVRAGSAGVRPAQSAASIVTRKSGRIIVVARGTGPFSVRLILRASGVDNGPDYSSRHVWRVTAAGSR